jgi:hypothetical protein
MPRTKVNKSKAIRECLSSNPSAMPKEVVAALAKNRIRVSTQMVSTIKSKMVAPKQGQVDLNQLLAAKVFVDRVGNIGEAKQAVMALAKLL